MTIRRGGISKFDAELEQYVTLDRHARARVLALLAHDLTAGIRTALLDVPSDGATEKIKALNEYLHQITARIYSSDEQSAHEERELLLDIAEDAETKGLKWTVIRRFGPALRHATSRGRSPVIA